MCWGAVYYLGILDIGGKCATLWETAKLLERSGLANRVISGYDVWHTQGYEYMAEVHTAHWESCCSEAIVQINYLRQNHIVAFEKSSHILCGGLWLLVPICFAVSDRATAADFIAGTAFMWKDGRY